MLCHLLAMRFSIAPEVPRFGPGFQLKMLMRVRSNKRPQATSVEVGARLGSHRPSFVGHAEDGNLAASDGHVLPPYQS